MPLADVPREVLASWRDLAGQVARPLGGGLINDTFLVAGQRGPVVVQRLHPIFAGVVNEDIEAVTAHVAARGMLTPRLCRTDGGDLWMEHDGRPWRAQTFIAGESIDRVDSPVRAREAASLVARFHAATADLSWRYRHVRAGVHDTPRHLAALARAVEEQRAHRLYDRVARLAEELLVAGERLPDLSSLPLRHGHGDLKISNVLFDAGGRAICLVDLDTLGALIWPWEMGDALRSWGNPRGEDVDDARLDPAIFRAAIEGYAGARGPGSALSSEERDALVPGLATICLELAARFLGDALCETYFGWDAARFPGRGEHNLLRAQGQASLWRSVVSQAGQLEAIVRGAWSV
ncbi:MAG: hypothetical protein EXR72_20545 [Myxococcales bacterium]|nr:hypothetical protein [Myxococcales bacterium]